MKFFKGKKYASLDLSINAIVILILAITMLGLGLGFMKNLFTKTTGQLGQVGEDIKAQMVEQLRTSPNKLTMNQEDISVKKGEKKEIYFAVKDVQSSTDAVAFDIKVECKEPLSGDNDKLADTVINYFKKTREIKQGEIDVQKMVIEMPSQSASTTHPCSLTVIDSSGKDYDKKSFFITVE